MMAEDNNHTHDAAEALENTEAEETCDGCSARVTKGKLTWKNDWDMWVCQECIEEDSCGCGD